MNLYDFKDRHKGKRCFIACNGPSLNDIPMEKLQGEIVFGLNRGYLKKGLPIKYHVLMVSHVAKQWEEDFRKLKCDVLFTNLIEMPFVCNTPFGSREFQTDMYYPLHRGHTVTYPTMQIAYGMGFSEVYLIGCDHSFSYKNTIRDETHHRAVITEGKDSNHFHPNYFGDGSVWLPYEPKMVEKNYRSARKAFDISGRALMNLSTYTELSDDIIRRGNFEDII